MPTATSQTAASSSARLRCTDPATLPRRFATVRAQTERFCEPLHTEDFVVQTEEHVSPTKWHLAHTSWFFETFVLEPHLDGFEPLNDQYAYLFNSYYIQAGERHCRDRRGYISRPTVDEVFSYRAFIDEQVGALLAQASAETMRTVAPLIELGIHHEQQHQELMVTDMKHVLSVNPLRPAYRDDLPEARPNTALPQRWVDFDEGLYEIGYDGDGFHYDNETPRHRTYVHPFQLSNRLVTNRDYMAFMDDGGYDRPELWLSAGWATVQEREWSEPYYWERHDDRWYVYTLGGMREVNLDAPACHLSYFEADAFARWSEARLPTEAEWEVAAEGVPVAGNFVEDEAYHPQAVDASASGALPTHGNGALHQMYGDVWEWTQSHYSPYPGYQPLEGAIGEYNGKFMCGQFVLRGGSCATSETHIRPTYRNFFHPDEAWQFMGLRLARSVR